MTAQQSSYRKDALNQLMAMTITLTDTTVHTLVAVLDHHGNAQYLTKDQAHTYETAGEAQAALAKRQAFATRTDWICDQTFRPIAPGTALAAGSTATVNGFAK